MKRFLKRQFSKKGKKGGVSFKSRPKVHHLPLHEQIPVEELWYRPEESQQIHEENRRQMNAMKNRSLKDQLENHVEEDIRGLEVLNSECRRWTRDCRRESTAVVLSAQSMQVLPDKRNEEALARAYRRACRESTQFARYLARVDEQYVIQHVRCGEEAIKPTFYSSNASVGDLTATTVSDDEDGSLYFDIHSEGGQSSYLNIDALSTCMEEARI